MVEPYVADMLYPPVPQSVGQARAWVRGQLRQFTPGLSDSPDGLELCVSELMTNAIRHSPAGYDVRLLLSVGVDLVRIEVRDLGDGTPRICRICSRRNETEHGRGLRIVKEYADGWGVTPDPVRGKNVWAVFKTTTYAARVRELDAAYQNAPVTPP